jgi:hypothetical protein
MHGAFVRCSTRPTSGVKLPQTYGYGLDSLPSGKREKGILRKCLLCLLLHSHSAAPLLPLYMVIFIETSSVPDKFLLVETGQVA